MRMATHTTRHRFGHGGARTTLNEGRTSSATQTSNAADVWLAFVASLPQNFAHTLAAVRMPGQATPVFRGRATATLLTERLSHVCRHTAYHHHTIAHSPDGTIIG